MTFIWALVALAMIVGIARAEKLQLPPEIPDGPPVLCLTGEYSSVPGNVIVIYANKLELAYPIFTMTATPERPVSAPPLIVLVEKRTEGPCSPYILAVHPILWRWGGSINPVSGVEYTWNSWVQRTWE